MEIIHSTKLRSFIKAASYRIVSTGLMTILVYLLTHKVTIAAAVLFLDVVVMTTIYYMHERLWQRIKWGRINEK